jgi:RecA-family ATPase
LAANLIVEPLENHNVDILNEQWFDALMRIAASRRLLILDTLRMAHSGDENDGGAMKKVTERLRMIGAQTGCTVIFLHHTNKTSQFNSTGNEQQASRGSSVLVDNVRLQYYLRTMTAAEAEENGIDEGRRRFFAEFGVSKQNYGVPLSPRWLQKTPAMDERIEAGYTLHSAVLERKSRGKTERRAETPPARPSQEGVNNGNW